jgi:molybdopterin-synthase adenylyltransferase
MLNEAQIQRYSRQLLLPEVGGAGQERLLAARVAVRARGEAAETLGRYLEAAGVGLGANGLAVGGIENPEAWTLSETGAAWAPSAGPCPACLAAALMALPVPPPWARSAVAQAVGALAASQVLLQLLDRGALAPALWFFWPEPGCLAPRRREACGCG